MRRNKIDVARVTSTALSILVLLLAFSTPAFAGSQTNGAAWIELQREFLLAHAKQAGWHETSDGLQYKKILSTKFEEVDQDDSLTITANYEGRLVDGTVFDSSWERHEPLEFRLRQVIRGWREGLPLMRLCEVWQFAIPPSLGYGARAKPMIPPNSVLLFEVQLIDVQGLSRRVCRTPPPVHWTVASRR